MRLIIILLSENVTWNLRLADKKQPNFICTEISPTVDLYRVWKFLVNLIKFLKRYLE